MTKILKKVEKWLELAYTSSDKPSCRDDGLHSNFGCLNCNLYFALWGIKEALGKSSEQIRKEIRELLERKFARASIVYNLLDPDQKKAVNLIVGEEKPK